MTTESKRPEYQEDESMEPSEQEVAEIGGMMLSQAASPLYPAAKLTHRCFMELGRALDRLPVGDSRQQELADIRSKVLSIANELRDEVWLWESIYRDCHSK